MKKVLGVILIVIGAGIGGWCFLVAVRMVANSSLSGISQIMAFVIYVLLVGGGIALVLIGRRLVRG